jgi:hypothetical protein
MLFLEEAASDSFFPAFLAFAGFLNDFLGVVFAIVFATFFFVDFFSAFVTLFAARLFDLAAPATPCNTLFVFFFFEDFLLEATTTSFTA